MPPRALFKDVTRSSGIRFTHENGAAGERLLPETMGGGVAFFDADNDGHQDLLFVNSTRWPWDTRTNLPPATSALYHNRGDGTFTEITTGSGLDVPLYGIGVAVGDFNNDGFSDVFLTTAIGPNRLFRNLGGGKFADVTDDAGVAGPSGWSTSAAWIDIDNDSDLDLFVCEYVRWSREIDFEVNYTLPGIGRAYGPPMNFHGTFPLLYRNDGDGTFSDISAEAGVQVTNAAGAPAAKALGVAPVDLDRDGWIDLIVANDTVANFVFHNQGNGVFKEVGALTGIAFDTYGKARGAMGIDTGDVLNQGAVGVGIGNFFGEMTALYTARDRLLEFSDDAIVHGIGSSSRPWVTFGLFFFDSDLDGRLDLLTTNGHIENEIAKIHPSQTFAQPAQFFWNAGHGNGFIELTPDTTGGDLFTPIAGRGSAFADTDSDGDLDVVFTQVAGPPLLLRNDQSLGHNWIRLKLAGRQSNRDAIGARVQIKAGGQTLVRQVMPARSYLSQSELPVTFGLGTSTRIDYIEITWPGNRSQSIPPETVPINRLTVIEEDAPELTSRR